MKGLLNLSAYYGGKASHAKHLLPILEAVPHTHYVEAFGGLAALLLNKKPCKVEVYNDVDAVLVTLMRVVREQPERLAEVVALTPYARDEYWACQQILQKETADELELARAAYTMLNLTFNSPLESGGFSTGGIAYAGNVATGFHNTSVFVKVAERLRNVILENTSWEKVFALYDAPGALIYLDPPYHPDTRSSRGYRFEWDRQDHQAFVEAICDAKAAVVVSGYDHPDYQPLVQAGWMRIGYAALTMQAEKGAARKRAEESVWLNGPAAAAQQQYSLFDERGGVR